MTDKVSMIAGVFFGLMFGLGGLGSAFFGLAGRQDECAVHFSNQYAVALAGGSYGLFTEHRTERNKKISDVSKNTK